MSLSWSRAARRPGTLDVSIASEVLRVKSHGPFRNQYGDDPALTLLRPHPRRGFGWILPPPSREDTVHDVGHPLWTPQAGSDLGGSRSVLIPRADASPDTRSGLPSAPKRRRLGPAQRSRSQTRWPRSSAHRFLHQRCDPFLFGGAQLLQRVRGRPHVTLVEVRRVAEAERRVPGLELRRVLEEADDLAALRVRGHPVPGPRLDVRRAGRDDLVDPFGHGAVRLQHGGDPFQNGLLLVLPARGRLPLPDGLLHRGDLFLAEPLILRALRGGGLVVGLLRRLPCCLLLRHGETPPRAGSGSAQLLDADQVARGIAEGAVAMGSCTTSASPACGRSKTASRSFVARLMLAKVPLAIISATVRRSSSVRPGVAAGGYRTMDVPGWSGGPTVIQCIPPYSRSIRSRTRRRSARSRRRCASSGLVITATSCHPAQDLPTREQPQGSTLFAPGLSRLSEAASEPRLLRGNVK